MSFAAMIGRRRQLVVPTPPEDPEEPPPDPGEFGAGPNAPTWADSVDIVRTFETPIPVAPAPADAHGFRGWQGFVGFYGNPRGATSYEAPVDTAYGSLVPLRITFSGQTNIIAANGATAERVVGGQESFECAIRIAGTWSGTLQFEKSTDDGETWSSATANPQPLGSGVTSTSTNGVWHITGLASHTDRVRVRASAWSSGSATVTMGILGGYSPARADFGTFVVNAKKLYLHLLYRYSANFDHNGVTGTKLAFFRSADGDGHYIDGTTGSTNVAQPKIVLQPERTFPPATSDTPLPVGQMVDAEFVIEANTPGVTNGVGRIYQDGVLVAERTDYHYFATAASTLAFILLFLEPTFGGGYAPPPANIYLEIFGVFIRSAP